jgi:dihydroflavonol-4-reductase
MKTLVTGGAGFVGSALVRELLRDGRAVRVLVRSSTDLRNLQGLDVERVEGDLQDAESLRQALAGCDTLYHTAAYYSFWDRDKARIYAINVDGTRNLFKEALRLGINRVVYTSTVGCVGLHPDASPSDETTPLDPVLLCNDYKLSKYQAEQTALEFFRNGLPVVIVNPSAPVGPHDNKPTPTGKMIVDFLNRKMPAYLDTGLNLIDVRDCARGHILAEQRGVPGERYILGNRNMSLREILLALEKITGIPAPSVKMPYWVAYAAGWLCEAVADHITHTPPAVPLAGVKMAKHFMYFNPAKAVRELGLPQNPVERALEDAVRWFRDSGMIE